MFVEDEERYEGIRIVDQWAMVAERRDAWRS